MVEFVKPRQDDAGLEFVVVEAPVERGSVDALQLKFNHPRQVDGQLELNVSGGGGGLPNFDLTGVIRSRPISITGFIDVIVDVGGTIVIDDPITLSGTMVPDAVLSGVAVVNDDPIITGTLAYDINVDRGPKSAVDAHHSETGFTPHVIHAIHSETGYARRTPASLYGSALTSSPAIGARHSESPELYRVSGVLHDEGARVYGASRHPWDNPDAVNIKPDHEWDQGAGVYRDHESDWENPPKLHIDRYAHHGDAADGFLLSLGAVAGEGADLHKGWLDHFEQAILPPSGVHPVVPVIPPVIVPDKDAILDFKALRQPDGHLEFIYIELDALIVMNEITVTHVAIDNTETPIHPVNLGVSIDLDSFTWTLTGELKGADSIQWLQSQLGKAPVIKLKANGWDWSFCVSSFDRSRRTHDTGYRFTADSQTRFLGEPHAAKRSDSVVTPISPWQLVEQRINPLGFDLDRSGVLDWVLPANSYSYSQLTPIALLKAVTAAVGGIVRPDRQLAKLTVQPRYKVSPWKWSTLSDIMCDHLVPESAVITESARDTSSPQLTAVTVSGTTHGVTTQVVKLGTAGDSIAPDVTDPLAQDHLVNAERGRNIMADSGDQELVSYSIPLIQDTVTTFGLIVPGDLVRILNDNGSKLTGLCVSNTIDMKSIDEIWQNINLEVHHGDS